MNRLHLKYLARAIARDNPLNRLQVRRLVRGERLDSLERRRQTNRLLARSLRSAIRKLPFYETFSDGFDESDALTVLGTFPIIDKDILRAQRERLYPNGGQKRPWQSLGLTSGTTGTPLDIFRSASSVLIENAFVYRHWSWGGFERGMRRAAARGDNVVPIENTTPPFWHYNRFNNQLLISSRHLEADFLEPIVVELARFRPAMLQVYPSTGYALASYLARHGRPLPIPAIFTSSEPLYPHQRELMETQFRGRVLDLYGMAERVAFASECEAGNLHVNDDYSYVEILDESGAPTNDVGYIVGTSFHNLAMPLIRYRMSDRTRWKQGICPCGRTFRMIEPIEGREGDAIRGSNGTEISPGVLTFVFKGLEYIDKAQLAQVGEGEWEIRVVPRQGFSGRQRDQLIGNVHKLVDPHVRVTVKEVSDIPRTAAGKFRWLVNEMEVQRM